VKDQAISERLKDEDYVIELLRGILTDILEESEVEPPQYPCVIMLVGVNGVGKTTTVGKLAHYFLSQGKTVTVAAADTFRAAASEQLSVWADRAKVRIVKHEEGSDPSAVIFDAVASVKAKKTDVLIVDTAGRLHVKDNLMKEMNYNGGKVIIDHCFNETDAIAVKEHILASFPNADVRIAETRGLCSFYAEVGGLLVGVEA
jgi:fused signal recognition particle receptor